MKRPPPDVAALHDASPSPQRETMLEMRKRILAIVPAANEVVKYGMPTFVVDGTAVAGLMAHRAHVGFYPYSGSILQRFPALLARYGSTKSALHVPVDAPLSATDLRRLVRAKLDLAHGRNTARTGVPKPAPKKSPEANWDGLRLGAPARSALASAGIARVEDLARFSGREIAALHGIGPSTLEVLVPEMERRGVSFR